MNYLKELKDAFSALDDALGDSDAPVESDEEEREYYPVQYAARIISGVMQDMVASEQGLHPTSESLRYLQETLTPRQLSALKELLSPLTCG